MGATKSDNFVKPQLRDGFPPDPVVDGFRRWGYLAANLDPLERVVPYEHPDLADAAAAGDAELVEWLRSVYCGSVGFEYMHMVEADRVEWMRDVIEAGPPEVDGEWILQRLAESELFERFLHQRYVGSKRFSVEGVAGMIPLLDAILESGSQLGTRFLYLAMSHRGRLNVMKNIVNIPGADIFAGMEDVDPRSVLGAGDVKYHLGATGRYQTLSGNRVNIHLSTNPSHLEAVDAVVMGRARARHQRWGREGRRRMLPVTLHGDAAFAGQGITAETLNFADIDGYTVGGTVRVIVNNLVGFTAPPKALHSTRFASDVARRLSIPIIHVNGEDPRALWWVGDIATRFRYEFKTDVVIDLVGFRRYGHSEVEDPTTTQPLLYERIKSHSMLWQSYGAEIGYNKDQLEEIRKQVTGRLSAGQEEGRTRVKRPTFFTLPEFWGRYHGGLHETSHDVDTGVELPRIREVAERLTTVPKDFNVHPKIAKLLGQRAEMAAGERGVDWGMAELLAFGTLLWDGAHVRLTGQDSRRGTFNQRHAVLVDAADAREYVPLEHLHPDQGAFTALDSPLSEQGALGFEYGYSREYPDGLICWEAQFGDFANGAQIIIDQFVSAAEDKWNLLSGLVILLPHGYEGQGPEHSSARIERFLTLAAQDNIQVAQPSTAAQYYHLLRRQLLRNWRKPLVVFTPKSMLRLDAATSHVSALTTGRFQTVIRDDDAQDVTGIVLCAGKIAHELRAERARRGLNNRAIVTIEQLYPFPEDELEAELDRYPNANKIVWVQEEPANMGALLFIRRAIGPIIGDRHLTTVKRYESASPATGSAKAHELEQKALIQLALS